MEWYFSIGLVLWILAQITRADETTGIKNNILCLLLFIVLWPKIIMTIACKFIEENGLMSKSSAAVKSMKPYIIRRIIAVACIAFWIAVALAVYFILR
ncbi:hypothetical protein WM027_12270 [Klebsiella pneumoniae]